MMPYMRGQRPAWPIPPPPSAPPDAVDRFNDQPASEWHAINNSSLAYERILYLALAPRVACVTIGMPSRFLDTALDAAVTAYPDAHFYILLNRHGHSKVLLWRFPPLRDEGLTYG